MFRKMRRAEKALEKNEIQELLSKGDYGILSVIQTNGYPYGVPVNYVYDQDSIYFHGAKEGNKNDSILNNSKVAFTVVGDYRILPHKFDTEYISAIVFGQAQEVFLEEKAKGLDLLIKKYAGGYQEAGDKYIRTSEHQVAVFKIRIEEMTGKLGR